MDTLELARELIRRPSVTPADAGCQELIEGLLRAAGFGVERLRFGPVDNLWARRGRAAPALVFAGHTDVVPPGPAEQWRVDPFAAAVVDGELVGRGAADMKGSLAAMINACRRFAERYPQHGGSLGMLITSDEEGAADDGTLKVMQTLAQRGETFQYCVVGEPSSAERLGDTVRVGRRGSLSGIMTIRGVQGHVAYPLQSDNPIHALAKFVAAITREPVDGGNEHFPPTTFQMVNVQSDAGAPNVVPGELKCRFNLRYSTVWTHAQLSAHIEALLKQLGISYEIRWRVAGEPFLTRPGKLTAAVQQAIAEEAGLTTELSTSGGTSDGRFIAPYGVDVIELGPINKTIHQVNEHVAAADLDRLERMYFRIAELLLAGSDASR
ncbi:MAG TPA: succinyl-diaminopimelate desuccinylase [Gammaproteobacteria bacterium]|nr:succinyl-diaminopimelate desuccinylase [Gammaproteobacteria bacterium]